MSSKKISFFSQEYDNNFLSEMLLDLEQEKDVSLDQVIVIIVNDGTLETTKSLLEDLKKTIKAC